MKSCGTSSASKVSALSLTLEMLDDAPETVAVGSDQHPLSLFDLWNDLFVPEGQSPGDGVLEALATGKLVLRQVGITAVLQTEEINGVSYILAVWLYHRVKHTSAFGGKKEKIFSCGVTLLMLWWKSCSSSIDGGGMSKERLQILTWASPCLAAVSALFSPVRPP